MSTNINFEEVELHTDRLVLKRSHVDLHCEEINALICDTIDSLRPWIAWAKDKPTVEDTRKCLIRTTGDLRHYSFRLFLQDTKKLIGVCGLVFVQSNSTADIESKSQDCNTYELGYYLHKDYVGKGFIMEAAQCIMTFAKEHLQAKRFIVLCMERNIPSSKTAERLGFKLVKKEQAQFDMRPDWGEFTDLLYEKLIT